MKFHMQNFNIGFWLLLLCLSFAYVVKQNGPTKKKNEVFFTVVGVSMIDDGFNTIDLNRFVEKNEMHTENEWNGKTKSFSTQPEDNNNKNISKIDKKSITKPIKMLDKCELRIDCVNVKWLM